MGTPKSAGKSSSKSVVLADNDLLIREAIGDLLRGKGYEVHPASDGLETLLLIRKVKPNYVILDIVMPKIDGSRVCWLIRQDRNLRDTPIIAFSGLSPQDIRRFPELSADAYVAKGPLSVVANNILSAIQHLEEKGRGNLEGGIFGYDGFRGRKLVSEMLLLKRHWETLLRMCGSGMLELDPGGRILMANPMACEILGKKETRLIAETFPSLFSPHDRRGVEDIMEGFAKARPPEERWAVLPLGERDITLRFSAAVDEGELVSILVTIEPK